MLKSSIIEDLPQCDGRRSVRERHADPFGGIHEASYLAEHDTDVSELLQTHAIQIAASETQRELDLVVQMACGGQDPRAHQFVWNKPQSAFAYLMQYMLVDATPEQLLVFQPVAATFTLDGLQQQLGILPQASQAILDLVASASEAAKSVEAVTQKQDQTAAALGVG